MDLTVFAPILTLRDDLQRELTKAHAPDFSTSTELLDADEDRETRKPRKDELMTSVAERALTARQHTLEQLARDRTAEAFMADLVQAAFAPLPEIGERQLVPPVTEEPTRTDEDPSEPQALGEAPPRKRRARKEPTQPKKRGRPSPSKQPPSM